MNKKRILTVFILICLVFNFCSLRSNQDEKLTFKRVSFDRIKNLEEKFRRKKIRNLLLKRGAYVASVVIACGIAAKLTYDWKKGKFLNKAKALDLSSQIKKIEDKSEHIFYGQTFSTRWRNYFLLSMVKGLGFSVAGGVAYSASQSYTSLMEWWKKKLDKVGSCTSEATLNLKALSNFLDGLSTFHDNESYLNFYTNQIYSVHNLLVDTIENLIAITAASLDKKKNKTEYDWLISGQNGLCVEIDSLTDLLELQLERERKIDSDFKEKFEIILLSLAIAIQHMKKDFSYDFQK